MPGCVELDLRADCQALVLQAVEAAAQRRAWREATVDRPRDAEGTQDGADMTVFWKVFDSVDPHEQGILRVIAAGALWGRRRKYEA
eukprot:7687922-Alexandrium_andersonii.AAC.1